MVDLNHTIQAQSAGSYLREGENCCEGSIHTTTTTIQQLSTTYNNTTFYNVNIKLYTTFIYEGETGYFINQPKYNKTCVLPAEPGRKYLFRPTATIKRNYATFVPRVRIGAKINAPIKSALKRTTKNATKRIKGNVTYNDDLGDDYDPTASVNTPAVPEFKVKHSGNTFTIQRSQPLGAIYTCNGQTTDYIAMPHGYHQCAPLAHLWQHMGTSAFSEYLLQSGHDFTTDKENATTAATFRALADETRIMLNTIPLDSNKFALLQQNIGTGLAVQKRPLSHTVNGITACTFRDGYSDILSPEIVYYIPSKSSLGHAFVRLDFVRALLADYTAIRNTYSKNNSRHNGDCDEEEKVDRDGNKVQSPHSNKQRYETVTPAGFEDLDSRPVIHSDPEAHVQIRQIGHDYDEQPLLGSQRMNSAQIDDTVPRYDGQHTRGVQQVQASHTSQIQPLQATAQILPNYTTDTVIATVTNHGLDGQNYAPYISIDMPPMHGYVQNIQAQPAYAIGIPYVHGEDDEAPNQLPQVQFAPQNQAIQQQVVLDQQQNIPVPQLNGIDQGILQLAQNGDDEDPIAIYLTNSQRIAARFNGYYNYIRDDIFRIPNILHSIQINRHYNRCLHHYQNHRNTYHTVGRIGALIALYRKSPANFVTGLTTQCAYTLWTDVNPAALIPNIIVPIAAYVSVRYTQPGTTYWRAIATAGITTILRFLAPYLYKIAITNFPQTVYSADVDAHDFALNNAGLLTPLVYNSLLNRTLHDMPKIIQHTVNTDDGPQHTFYSHTVGGYQARQSLQFPDVDDEMPLRDALHRLRLLYQDCRYRIQYVVNKLAVSDTNACAFTLFQQRAYLRLDDANRGYIELDGSAIQHSSYRAVKLTNWADQYPNSAVVYRLGMHVQLVVMMAQNNRVVPIPQNMPALLCTYEGERCYLQPTRLAVDQMRQTFTATVYDTNQSYHIRMNRVIQMLTPNVSQHVNITVLGDTISEHRMTYEKANIYLHQEGINATQIKHFTPTTNDTTYPLIGVTAAGMYWSVSFRMSVAVFLAGGMLQMLNMPKIRKHTTELNLSCRVPYRRTLYFVMTALFGFIIYPTINRFYVDILNAIGLTPLAKLYAAIQYTPATNYVVAAGRYIANAVAATTNVIGPQWARVGSNLGVRQHVSREYFENIIHYNGSQTPQGKIFLPQRTIYMNDELDARLTIDDAHDIYDYLEQFCTCNQGQSRTAISPLDTLSSEMAITCFTNCPINATAAMFMRQLGCLLNPDPQVVAQFRAHTLSPQSFTQQYIERYNTTGNPPSIQRYMLQISQQQPSKLDSYLRMWKKIKNTAIFDTNFIHNAKDGEYKITCQCSVTMSEPRCITKCPESCVVHGGAVNQCITETMLTFDEVAICRTPEWIKSRIQSMISNIPGVEFYGADGSRFDSSQHQVLKDCVDNRIYNRTQIYEQFDATTDEIVQAKRINTQSTSTFQQFVGKGKNKVLFMRLDVYGTMNSGKGDTGSMNTARQIEYFTFARTLANLTKNQMDFIVAGDDVLIGFAPGAKIAFDMHAPNLWARAVNQPLVHGLGQCVKEWVKYPAGCFAFLSKIGLYDSGNIEFVRQIKRICELQVTSDSAHHDTLSLQSSLSYSLLHALGSSPLTDAMIAKLPLPDRISYLDAHETSYWRYMQTLESHQTILPAIYQDLITRVGEDINDPSYYMERYLSVTSNYTKRSICPSYTPAPHQSITVYKHRDTHARLAPSVSYFGAVTRRLITLKYLFTITQNNKVSQKLMQPQISSQAKVIEVERGARPYPFIEQKVDSQYKFIQIGGMSKPDIIAIREVKADYLHDVPTKNRSTQGYRKYMLAKLPQKILQNATFDIQKLTYGGTKQAAGKVRSSANRQTTSAKRPLSKSQSRIRSSSKVSTKNKTNNTTCILSKGDVITGKWLKIGAKSRGLKHEKGSFAHSVLKVFKYPPIKPYFDYPLNTSLLEQTLELNVGAILSTGTGIFPAGQYGCILAIAPHSFNDFANWNGGSGFLVGQTSANLRFITQYSQGLGGYADVYANYASPLNGFQGLNNSVNARYTSARVVRLGIRIIPISAQITRQGYINIVQIPGKDLALQFGGASSSIAVPIPNASQMKTYSTSYEASNASNTPQHDYVWVPTDVLDSIFVQDQLNVNQTAGTILNVQGDMETVSNKMRNMMYFVGSNLASTDAFRVEIKVTYEFVPTTTFKQWANTEGPRAVLSDQQQLKDIIVNSPTAQSIQEGRDDNLFNKILGYGSQIYNNQLVQEAVSTGARTLMRTMF